MFSAHKLVAAGVIAAFLGGSLISAVDGAPRDVDVPPPAASGSYVLATAAEFLPGIDTDEIEPGVFRFTDDGIHHLWPDIDEEETGFPALFVDVAPDGGAWFSGGGDLGDGLYRLGDDRDFQDAGDRWGPWRQTHFAPDGTLWAHDGDSVRSFSDEVWVVRDLHETRIHDLAARPDGAVWAVMVEDLEDSIAHSVVELTSSPDTGPRHLELVGSAGRIGEDFQPDRIEAAGDGTVWVLGTVLDDMYEYTYERHLRLLRHDEQGWQAVDLSPLDRAYPHHFALADIASGPDGTLWLVADLSESGQPRGQALARFDGDGWSTFATAENELMWGHRGIWLGSYLLDVAPDGALWLNISDDYDVAGVARFDGVTWQRFLDGHRVHDLDVGPDGSVWVRAEDPAGGRGAAYVITLAAVAGLA